MLAVIRDINAVTVEVKEGSAEMLRGGETLCAGGGGGRLVRRPRRSCPFDPVVQLDVFEKVYPEKGVPFMVHRLRRHCDRRSAIRPARRPAHRYGRHTGL